MLEATHRNSPMDPTTLVNGISDSESYEGESYPERVLARGYGLSTGLAGQPNSFKLDARDAGFGDFDVVIKGASRATIEYIEEEEAVYKIKYHVKLPGDYQIEIKYDMKHIPGSPFTTKIMEPANNNIDSTSSQKSASPRTTSIESFSTSTQEGRTDDERTQQDNMQALPIDANVVSPSGKVIKGVVYQKANKEITVKFPREEIGMYKVTLKKKESAELVAGSPFEIFVRSKDPDSTLTAAGDGLNEVRLDGTNGFTIAGKKNIDNENLWIMMYGAGPCKLNVFQNESDSLDVLYEVKKVGSYFIHVRDNKTDIPGSPFVVTTNTSGTKTTLGALVATVWHGYIDSDNSIKTKLKGPDDQYVSHIASKKGKHSIDMKFLPSQNGEYLLKVFSESSSIQEEFNIPIHYLPEDEELVQISGDGLQSAVVEVLSKFFIKSVVPPLNSFSVEFDGPSTVEITQKPREDGQCVIEYFAHTPGRYVLSIKYDGFHVGKSPYFINMFPNETTRQRESMLAIENENNVSDEGDASKCVAAGKALYTANVGKPMSFTVDTTNAGCGGLMAGFKGSKKRSEISCKNCENHLYEVQYKVWEKGTYKLAVLWDGEKIPGSPFTIIASED